ncbi:MAG: HAMP domain-containing protein [Deltaproteobacteria bacterium]|nr:HAMP domain-containing protein [Deltaproteobacteria bacterium]
MAAGAVAIVLVAIVLHYFLVDSEKRHMVEKEEQTAKTLATAMKLPFTQILLYEESGIVSEAGLLDLYISRMVGSKDLHIRYAMVFDPKGRVLSHSDLTLFNRKLDDPLSRKALSADGIVLSHIGDPFDGGVIDVGTPLNVSSKRFGTLRFGYSLAGLEDRLRQLKRKTLGLTVSAAAVMIFLVFVASRVMTRPIRRLAGALDSVRLGKLEPIPLPDRRDEIGDLQNSYRMMIGRLEKEKIGRERTQDLLARTEKMATVGTLAAGIAHEINSPLTGAMHSVRALASGTLPAEKRDRYLQVLVDGLERIRRAVSQLLDYSTVHVTNITDCDLSGLVEKSLELLEYQITGNRIEVENRLPPLVFRADAHKMEQVIVNLVLNAVGAMPRGGRLAFRHIEEGPFLTLIVSDTGEGIPEENMGKIFEPFFTTKGNGKGTGLGLAVCRKIIEQHGGRISVSSRPGDGTEFRISLPFAPTSGGDHER